VEEEVFTSGGMYEIHSPNSFFSSLLSRPKFFSNFPNMISMEVRVHHVPPIRILNVIHKVGGQGCSLASSTLRHNGQIFIFVKNDVMLSWQMNK
jgi:hypothetical protein